MNFTEQGVASSSDKEPKSLSNEKEEAFDSTINDDQPDAQFMHTDPQEAIEVEDSGGIPQPVIAIRNETVD